VRAGALALLAGLGVFLANLGRMFRHFWRPRLEPLPGAGLSTTPADATSK
jgi:hypothetical protein